MAKLIRLSILVVGAFASWGLWMLEVRWVKGWAGLAWLQGFNWSALPICAIIVTVCGFLISGKGGWVGFAKFAGFGFILTTAGFVAARWAAFEIFSGGMPSSASPGALIVLVMTGLVASVGLTKAADHWVAPLRNWTWVLVAVALLLSLPLSFATIRVLPALNASTDQIHSIKMGYPVFWTALLVPLALLVGRKNLPVSE